MILFEIIIIFCILIVAAILIWLISIAIKNRSRKYLKIGRIYRVLYKNSYVTFLSYRSDTGKEEYKHISTRILRGKGGVRTGNHIQKLKSGEITTLRR